MKNPKYTFYLAGQEVTNPLDWQELQILSTFQEDGIQANISSSELTFPLQAAKAIKEWVRAGMASGMGIFEGIPLDIQVSEGDKTFTQRFIIDFETYTELEDRKVTVSIRPQNGLNQISDRLEAITFGWLESQGKVKKSDYVQIPYMVQKEFDVYELITISITLAIMTKAVIDATAEIGQSIAIQAGISSSSLTGAVGGTVYRIASIAVAIAKAAAVLIALKQLFQQILDAYIPVPRKSYTMTLQRGFEIVCEYLGYTPNTNLPLDRYYYLPSNTSLDSTSLRGFVSFGRGTQKGIPQSNDYGYSLSEFMDLLKKLFNGKFAVLDDVLYFRNVDDLFWEQNSTFAMRQDTFIEATGYNTADLKANFLLKFRTDIADTWTITQFKGTNYEVITRPKTFQVEKNILLKGLEQIEIPVALGTKKTEKTVLDNILLASAKIVDSVTRVFGGNTNYERQIKAFQNVLRVSSNNWTVPKLLYLLPNLTIPDNHRDILSAKAIYQNYYFGKSFVQLNGIGQKLLFQNVRIPFGYSDFVKLQNNAYMTDFKGRKGKVTNLRWSVGADYAVIDFWVREKYTNNLKEDYIEAE